MTHFKINVSYYYIQIFSKTNNDKIEQKKDILLPKSMLKPFQVGV